MIGIDTNVLVRYLAQDDPAQSAMATELIEQRLTGRNPGLGAVRGCRGRGSQRSLLEGDDMAVVADHHPGPVRGQAMAGDHDRDGEPVRADRGDVQVP